MQDSTAPLDATESALPNRRGILVLGMHRGGTSALAGLLVRLGADPPRTLMPPDRHNPHGYWESQAVLAFHERLLQSADSRWDAWMPLNPQWLASATAAEFRDHLRGVLEHEFSRTPLFVAKDPRICLLVPFWLASLESMNVTPAPVLTIRNPIEVAHSLETRNGLRREHALLMWLRHMLDAEFGTRNVVRSIVHYRDLLADWKEVAAKISADLKLQWPKSPTDKEIAQFLRTDLRHHVVDSGDVDVPFRDWFERTKAALDVLARPGCTETHVSAHTTLDEVRGQLDRIACVVGPVFTEESRKLTGIASHLETDRKRLVQHASNLEAERTELRKHASNMETMVLELRSHIANLEAQRSHLGSHVSNLEVQRDHLRQRATDLARELALTRQQLDELLNSVSWRLTAPLRAAQSLMRNQRRPDRVKPRPESPTE